MIKLRGVGEGLNGFMDEGTELLGELRFKDTLRIDGRVKGKIVSDNTRRAVRVCHPAKHAGYECGHDRDHRDHPERPRTIVADVVDVSFGFERSVQAERTRRKGTTT